MASNINHTDNHSAIAATSQPLSTERIAPQEAALFREAKIVQTLITTCLTILALGAAAAGTALTVIFASPAFLALMVVAVLFAIVACVAYKGLALKAKESWQTELNNYFKTVPDSVAATNFVDTQGSSFWQNKFKPNVYLALPHNLSTGNDGPYSLKLPVTHKMNPLSGASSKNGVIVNSVNPNSNCLDTDGTPISKDLFAAMSQLTDGVEDWNKSIGSPQAEPFQPLEVRIAGLGKSTSHLSSSEKNVYPKAIFHIRAPQLDDFQGKDEELESKYYYGLKMAYTALLERAAQLQSDTLTLPLFSAVNETEPTLAAHNFSAHKADCLCLAALISSVQDIATSGNIKGRMLIVVQKHKSTLDKTTEDSNS